MRTVTNPRFSLLGLGLLLAGVLTSCERDPAAPAIDAQPPDARPDVALGDARPDTGLPDVSLLDAEPADASVIDADVTDAGPDDGGSSDGGGLTCPSDMMLINGNYCIDVWEASRPDATALYPGVDTSYAVSAPDRYPWWSSVLTAAVAGPACSAAGKRLCTADEWQTACAGSQQTVYGYGDTYDATLCNGIDTHCNCTHATCAAQPTCPYAHCWSQCGGSFWAAATGSFPSCVNDYGLYDMNGNVWEVVISADTYPFRGGAFNCANSVTNHTCTFVPYWSINARGFRCCRDPI